MNDVLTQAGETLATDSGYSGLKLQAREARAIHAATTSLGVENLDLLQQLESEYLRASDRWSAARMASELSALFIRTKRFGEALAPSERGLKIFEELGDEYGISICKRNKASALLETPGKFGEGGLGPHSGDPTGTRQGGNPTGASLALQLHGSSVAAKEGV